MVLYARVSTQQQADKQLSISAQLRALRAYADDKGWEIVDEYIDKAKSGLTSRRPEFARMLLDIKYRDIDAIFVWKLDRLARNMEISTALDVHCRECRVRVISLHEPIDDTPQGKLTARIFESFAEFYSNNLSQDIQRGKREAAQKGFYPHGCPPIGYRTEASEDGRDSRKRLLPDDVYGPIIARIFQEYAKGGTGPQIAKSLNSEGLWTSSGRRWTTQRIYDILRNPVYCGDIVVGRFYVDPTNKIHSGKNPVTVKDVHPPLVERGLFEEVQRLLDSRSTSYQKRCWDVSPYLLSGLVRCGLCGRHMVVKSAKSGRYHYYTCQKYLKEGKEACSGIRVSSKKLESFVLARVRDVILDEGHLRKLVTLVNEELSDLSTRADEELTVTEKCIAQTQQRLARHYQALETGALRIRDLAPRIRELRDELSILEHRRAQLMSEGEQIRLGQMDAGTIEQYVRNLRKTLALGTSQERKAVLAGVIEDILVDGEKVEIEYRLPCPKDETEDMTPLVLPAVRSTGAWGIRTRDTADDELPVYGRSLVSSRRRGLTDDAIC